MSDANPFDALDGLSADLPKGENRPLPPRSDRPVEPFANHLSLPDLWQQEAIRALKAGHDVIVDAPTGAGKTFVFETYLAGDGKHPRLTDGRQAVYTVPTRALANDKFSEWYDRGWPVGIATGDLAEDLDAPILVATLETQRERLLRGEDTAPGLLVIDEYQMIADSRRGLNYELAVALAPADTQLLLLSGSVSNPEHVARWLERLGRKAKVIATRQRPVPLNDVSLQALPEIAPRQIRNHWQRLAVGALMSDFGPLLIFAPQRSVAEKIARKIASALPADDPIGLDDHALIAAGPELSRVLRKRVAWHHSGLSFTQRASIVEPLAKAGQLRVIVATTGLAAGINFSVRSVHITDAHYRHGPYEKYFGADELLQMFGRAGRRGLDEQGFVISSDTSPRLCDAHSLQLRRSNDLDWPTLLRVMQRAVEAGEEPFSAAGTLRDRLFSEQRIRLGFTFEKGGLDLPRDTDASANLFGIDPATSEVLNSRGEWETFDPSPGRIRQTPLTEAYALSNDRWIPALKSSELVGRLIPKFSRLSKRPGKTYGFEIAVANQLKESGGDCYRLNKRLRSLTRRQKQSAQLEVSRIEALIPTALDEAVRPGQIDGFQVRGDTLYATGDLSRVTQSTYRDHAGRNLIEPPRRSVVVKTETHYTDAASGVSLRPPADSAAWAWRKLGLIDAGGAPTARGRLFSFFQHGEGLAIAAAIADDHYPIDELIDHLANLRGGYRFESARLRDGGGSERLAYVCRQTFGTADFPGYLELGLPPGFGEGTAEAIAEWRNRSERQLQSNLEAVPGEVSFGSGDVERAYIEWLSLLRHIRHAPAISNLRWQQLQFIAAERLREHHQRQSLHTPAMTRTDPLIAAHTLNRPRRHRLTHRQLTATQDQGSVGRK